MARADEEKLLKELLESAAKAKAKAAQLKTELVEDEAALKELKDVKAEMEKVPE